MLRFTAGSTVYFWDTAGRVASRVPLLEDLHDCEHAVAIINDQEVEVSYEPLEVPESERNWEKIIFVFVNPSGSRVFGSFEEMATAARKRSFA